MNDGSLVSGILAGTIVVKEERHELCNLLSVSSNLLTASFKSGYYGH